MNGLLSCLALLILIIIGACLHGLRIMKPEYMKIGRTSTNYPNNVIEVPSMPPDALIYFESDRIRIHYEILGEYYKIFYHVASKHKLTEATLQSGSRLTITLSSTEVYKNRRLISFETRPSSILTLLNGWKILFHEQVSDTSVTIEIYRGENFDDFKSFQVFTAKSDPWSNVVTLEDSLGRIYKICINKIGVQSFLYQDAYDQIQDLDNFSLLKGTYFKFTLDGSDCFATIDGDDILLYTAISIAMNAATTEELAWFHGIPNIPPSARISFEHNRISIYYEGSDHYYAIVYEFADLYKLTRTMLQGGDQSMITLMSAKVYRDGTLIPFTPRPAFAFTLLNGWKILFHEQISETSVTIEMYRDGTLDPFKNCQVFTARKVINSATVILNDSSNRTYKIKLSTKDDASKYLLFHNYRVQVHASSSFNLLKGTCFKFTLGPYDYYATIDHDNTLLYMIAPKRFFTD